MISPRVAPPVFGLGLLEAIDESDILSRVDENDADHDGISGKPNHVWDELKQQTVLGRFGDHVALFTSSSTSRAPVGDTGA